MSEFENLKNAILREAEEEAAKVIHQGEKEAAKILAKAEESAAEFKKIGERERRKRAEDLKKRLVAACEREVQAKILKEKHRLVAEVFKKTKENLKKMGKKDYQDFLLSLIARADLTKGKYEILVAQHDLERVGKDFVEKANIFLKKRGVELVFKGRTLNIDGGLILKSKEIEENLSIEALLKMEKEEIVQKMMKSLFQSDEGEQEA